MIFFTNFMLVPGGSSFIDLLISQLGGKVSLYQASAILVVVIALNLFTRTRMLKGGLFLSRSLALVTGVLGVWNITRLEKGASASLPIILLGISFIYNQLQAETTSAIAAGGFAPETPQERLEVARKAVQTMAVSWVGMMVVSVCVAAGQVFLPMLGFIPGSAPAIIISGMAQALVAPAIGLMAVLVLARGGLLGSHVFPDRTYREVARLRRMTYGLVAVLIMGAASAGFVAWLYRQQPFAVPAPILLEAFGPGAISSLIGGGVGALVNWRCRCGKMPQGRRESGEFNHSLIVSSLLVLLSTGLGFGLGSLVGGLLPATKLTQPLVTSLQSLVSGLFDTIRYSIYARLRTDRMPVAVVLAAAFERPQQELIEVLNDDILGAHYAQLIAELDLRSLRFFLGNLRSLEDPDVVFALTRLLAKRRTIGRRVIKSVDYSTLLQLLYPAGRLNVAALDIIPGQKLAEFVERGDLGERNLSTALKRLSPEEVARVVVAIIECGAQRFDFVKWALAPFLTEPVWEAICQRYGSIIQEMASRLMALYARGLPSYAHALQSLIGTPSPTTPTQPPQPPAGAPQPPAQPGAGRSSDSAVLPQAAYPTFPQPFPTRPGGPTQGSPSPRWRRSLEQRRKKRDERLRGPQSSAKAVPGQALPTSSAEPATEEGTMQQAASGSSSLIQQHAGAPGTPQPTSPPVQAPPAQAGALGQTARQQSAQPAPGAGPKKPRRSRRRRGREK